MGLASGASPDVWVNSGAADRTDSSPAALRGQAAPAPATVLFVIDYYCGFRGGTEGQLFELLRHLPRYGLAPRLVVLRPTPFTRSLRKFCCPVETLGIRRIRSFATLGKLLHFAWRLRRERIPIVHVLFNDAAVIIPLFARLAGARVLVSRRDMGFWYAQTSMPVLRTVDRFVDRFVANSRAVADQVIASERVEPDRLRIVRNGYAFGRDGVAAHAELRRRLGLAATAPIVGVVANLSPVKRHADLLNAFVLIRHRHPEAHLVFAGSGSLRKRLERQVARLHLGEHVHFLGHVDEVIPIVKHFSVGVLCSDSEGFSNALIEYMACGLSPVCTRTGGNVELIDDGETGFLVDVGDVQAIADRISRLLSDRALAGRMGHAARQRVEQYTVSRMVKATVQVYRELLPGASG